MVFIILVPLIPHRRTALDCAFCDNRRSTSTGSLCKGTPSFSKGNLHNKSCRTHRPGRRRKCVCDVDRNRCKLQNCRNHTLSSRIRSEENRRNTCCGTGHRNVGRYKMSTPPTRTYRNRRTCGTFHHRITRISMSTLHSNIAHSACIGCLLWTTERLLHTRSDPHG